MESSEINTQVINLGKKLISELRLDFDNDITARWMAHYVAEKIVAAEKPDSTEVERDCCFDAILKLWNHRYSCPEEVRPFQRFESVYAGLARLDISSDSHYFQRFEKLSPETIKKLDDRSKQWVDLALAVDNGARFMISELFSLATASASSDEIKEILKTTPDPHAPDIQLLRQLVGGLKDENKEQEKDQLESNIQTVLGMKESCEIVLSILNTELKHHVSAEEGDDESGSHV